MSKIMISTEDKQFSVDLDYDVANSLFCSIVESLIKDEIEQTNFILPEECGCSNENVLLNAQQTVKMPLTHVREVEVPPEDRGTASYRGFLYIKCEKCGEIKGFNAKEPISEYLCRCGHRTPLDDLRIIFANCECGKKWTYATNLKQVKFDINCVSCRYPIPVEYNAAHKAFKTIK